jgi:tetratricopeptide (TPR) repeat protein
VAKYAKAFVVGLAAIFLLVARAYSLEAGDMESCRTSANDPAAGVPACTRLIGKDSTGPQAAAHFNDRGVGKVHLGEIAEAIRDFNSALERNPTFVDAYKNRAIAFQLSSDFDRAILDFSKAIRMRPGSAELHNGRGVALLGKNEFDRAIVDFDQAIASDKSFAKAYVNRGLANIYRRRLKKAITDFDEVVRLMPTNPIGYTNRAIAAMDSGQLDLALNDLTEAIRLRPAESGGYSRRGEAWRLKGELEKSLQDHYLALELEKTPGAFTNRALTWKDKDRLDDAIQDCTEALVLDPQYYLAYANRGEFRRLTGEMALAFKDLDKAIELSPKSPVALTYRGGALREAGQLQRALRDFDEAIRNVPDFLAAFVGRGLTYEKINDRAKAKLDYQRALALDPDVDSSLAKPARDIAETRLRNLNEEDKARLNAEAEAARFKVAAANTRTIEAQTAAKAAAEKREEAEAKERELVKSKQSLEHRLQEVRAKAEAQARAREADYKIQLAKAEAQARSEAEARAKEEVERRVREEVSARQAALERETQAKGALQAESGVRIALIVGNSDYAGAPRLANPGNDADAVAATFTRLGFQSVIAGKDLSRSQFLTKLREFEDKVATADWAVVYYAGHGVELDGTNFLLPVDATLKADRDIHDEGISLDRVLQAAERAKKLRLVILDSCRDNPFLKKMRRTRESGNYKKGLAKVEPEAGTLVAFAARDGEVSQDGSGPNSPFTSSFLKYVQQPNLEINMLFRKVRDDVYEQTRRRQEPFVYGSLTSANYYFVAN